MTTQLLVARGSGLDPKVMETRELQSGWGQKGCHEVTSATFGLGIREDRGPLPFHPGNMRVVVYLTLLIGPLLEQQGGGWLCVAGKPTI